MKHFFRDKHRHYSRPVEPRYCICIDHSSLSGKLVNKSRKEMFVDYIRGMDDSSVAAKLELIEDFCERNQFRIVTVRLKGSDHPSFAFRAVIKAPERADGLIAVDFDQQDNAFNAVSETRVGFDR